MNRYRVRTGAASLLATFRSAVARQSMLAPRLWVACVAAAAGRRAQRGRVPRPGLVAARHPRHRPDAVVASRPPRRRRIPGRPDRRIHVLRHPHLLAHRVPGPGALAGPGRTRVGVLRPRRDAHRPGLAHGCRAVAGPDRAPGAAPAGARRTVDAARGDRERLAVRRILLGTPRVLPIGEPARAPGGLDRDLRVELRPGGAGRDPAPGAPRSDPARSGAAGSRWLRRSRSSRSVPAWPVASTGSFRVAAVQGASDAGLFAQREPGQTLQDHLRETIPLIGEKVDLVVWPENAADVNPLENRRLRRARWIESAPTWARRS